MTELELVEQLMKLPDLAAKRRFLEEHRELLNDEVARLLDMQAAHFLRADIRVSLEIADLVFYMAELTGNPFYRGWSRVLEADARCIGMGEYESAIALYDQAAEIYRTQGNPAREAWSLLGKINALSYVGRYAEALEIGRKISPVLEAQGWRRSLAVVTMNMGIVHGRRGEDSESLAMFDRAVDLYQQLGQNGKTDWALIQQNRAVALRNMGRFDESIDASHLSSDTLLQLNEPVEAARAQQGLALTYFVLGRFNESLELLDHVRNVFLADARKRDAMLVELYLSDCLLQLRRFPEVIEKCQHVRGLFSELGTRQVEALAIINEAVAYAELHEYEEALASLTEARMIFHEAGNEVRVASTDLERSAVYLCQGRYQEGNSLARACIVIFQKHQLPIEAAQALIVTARSALALAQNEEAQQLLVDALQIGKRLNIPTVRYQAHSLLAELAQIQGNVETAQLELDCAIEEVEHLRGRLMVEFRVSFLEDKEAIYQDMVEICINQREPLRGLEYTERAKSRALLDLLAYRLDLTIQARNAEEQPVVEQLTQLRSKRDQLYRRWESDAESGENNERGWSSSQSFRQKAQQEVLVLEQQITELWHRLLVHNADYAREASLWTVRTESPQPYLDNDTLLVEYYAIRGKLVAFLVSKDAVQVRRLESELNAITSLMQRLQLNLQTVPKSPVNRLKALSANAQALLRQLYQLLVSPLEDQFAGYSKLIIVPHGPMHYLPFHALHDGISYLLERYEICYLPSASSLRYCRERRSSANRSVVMGYSNGGGLPHAVEEARMIAELLDGQALLEEQASLSKLYKSISDCHTLHLATHGDFRLDNPLFSGLSFFDGWLTTMDIFNLRLNASLVTLSACQTGLNVLGGGDELLGLMRAFLSAGAASVALTLWAVEDRSTARIMEMFYRNLVEHKGKGESLRNAQLQFIRASENSSQMQPEYYMHPYFWAPFFLVGDAGPL